MMKGNTQILNQALIGNSYGLIRIEVEFSLQESG